MLTFLWMTGRFCWYYNISGYFRSLTRCQNQNRSLQATKKYFHFFFLSFFFLICYILIYYTLTSQRRYRHGLDSDVITSLGQQPRAGVPEYGARAVARAGGTDGGCGGERRGGGRGGGRRVPRHAARARAAAGAGAHATAVGAAR